MAEEEIELNKDDFLKLGLIDLWHGDAMEKLGSKSKALVSYKNAEAMFILAGNPHHLGEAEMRTARIVNQLKG